MDEIDRLESNLEAARKAVIEHLHNAAAAEYAGGPWTGQADTPVDQAWSDRYDQLKAAADQALSAAEQSWRTGVVRMRRQQSPL